MDAEIGLLIASDVPEALDPLKLSAVNMAVLTPEGLVLTGGLMVPGDVIATLFKLRASYNLTIAT